MNEEKKKRKLELHVESLGRLTEEERRAREAQLARGATCNSLRGDNYSHFSYRLVEEVRVELVLLKPSKTTGVVALYRATLQMQ